MFQRLWNFAKRHKKKFLFTGILAGGAIFAWRVLLPRLQERLLLAALEALTKEVKEGAAADSAEEQAAKRRQQWRKARFRHRQEESDKQVRFALAKGDAFVSGRHRELCGVEGCMAKVREAPKAEQEQQFCKLQVVVIAQMVSAVYALNLLLLLHRVIYNIVGRNQDANSADANSADDTSPTSNAKADTDGLADDTAYEKFYEVAACFQDRGIEYVVTQSQNAVEACHNAAELGPRSEVKSADLENFLMTICTRLNSEALSEGSNMVLAVLPEGVCLEGNKKVEELLNEARDYIESPQFHEAMRVVVSNSMKQLVDSWGDAAPDPKVSPLGEGRAVKMAKLHRHFTDARNAALNAKEDENPLLTQFAKESVVTELCEAIDFEENVKAP